MPHHDRALDVICLAVWFLGVLAGSPAGAGEAEGSADAFARATSLLMAGDAHGAVREYEGYAEAHPQDRLAPVAALAAGRTRQLALADIDGALPWFERVLIRYPGTPWAADAARRKAQCLAARRHKGLA